ncbi:MAG: hypothetical protein QM765_16090 [Myxococcales bacterium]
MASKIGEILQAKGLLTGPQLEEALKKQIGHKARLGTILVEMGVVDVDQVAEALAEQRGFPPATRKDFEAATAITLVCIPAPFAQQFKAFPLRRDAGKLVVAFATPYERAQVEPIRSMAGMELVPCIAPELLLLYYQEMRYRLKRPERFAHWSPAPTSQPAAAAGASPAPSTDLRQTTVRFGSSAAAPLSAPPAPAAAPEGRQGTALFGLGAVPPAASQPKLSIPAPASPPAPSSPSQPSKASLLEPKPAATISAPVTPSVSAPTPVVQPVAPAPAAAPQPIPTPAPMPAVASPAPAVTAPAPVQPKLDPPPPPASPFPSAKSIPTPAPMPAIAAAPVVVVAPTVAPVSAPVEKAPEVRVNPTVPVEAKRSEPELVVASPSLPVEAKPAEIKPAVTALPFDTFANEPEPFSTPRPPGSAGHEGPTTPISPELLAIAQQPEAMPSAFFNAVEEPPVVQGDPLVEDPTPVTAIGQATPAPGWGDAMPAASIPEPPKAESPAAVPAEALPAPEKPVAAEVPPKRTTKEEMPAAILASEVETGLKLEEERREKDRDVTNPRIVSARDLFESSVGKPLESGPASKSLTTTNLYGKPDSDTPKTEETTLPERAGPPVSSNEATLPMPAKEQSLVELASELSEQVEPTKGEVVPSPAEIAKTAPPPPRKTVRDRPSERPAPAMSPPVNAPVMKARPGGSKLFLGIGIGAVAALVLGGAGVTAFWPKPPPPPPPPVVCKECPPLPPPPPEPQKATLEGADGLVERLGLDGEWVPAAANAVIADGEQVRTGQGARAKLRIGAGLVVIGEYSRVALRSATTAAHRFRLNAGFASFQYNAAALPFEIELAQGKTLAVGKADVTVFADEVRAALSPRAGSVEVAAANGAGKKIEVAVGKQVTVGADGTFAEAVERPAKLELNLEAPKKGDGVWLLEGSVVGGPARVVVEGTPVLVDAESHFSHPIKMPAKGPFNAAAVDVAGNRLTQEFPAPAPAPKKGPAPKKDPAAKKEPAPKKDKKGAGKK